MSSDISLQPESEFTSDMVKAVENIAVNVKLGSAEFSSSIDSLSKAIDGLKSSLIDSINSLKSSASNVAPSSPSAAPRASQGRSPSAQDPAVAKQKEDDKRAKAEVKALNLKTAQERAIFNAKKLQLQIENANEGKTTRRKKADADTQQQSIEDVFKNVGDGFGAVFAVTKEQMAGMRTSGKKGKKEKPFEMDTGALASSSVSEFEVLFEDLASAFSVGIKGVENNSDVVDVASELLKNLMYDIKEEVVSVQRQEEQDYDYNSESIPVRDNYTPPPEQRSAEDIARVVSIVSTPIIDILQQTADEMASVVSAVRYSGGDSYSVQEEQFQGPVEPYYSPFIGMPEEQPPLVGPTQENEARYNQLQEEDKIIKDGVGNFSVLFEAMFGKMGKSIQNVIATTVSGINQSFSDKSPVLDTVKSMFGFASVNKKVETSKSQTLSSGGTVGYFAKGTKPKSGMGGIFEGIGSVFSNMFGGKKKKKKKKSLLNNDENNWDTDTNYENKYKNYRADGGEIDDENTPFKPKGTDTVPAMLTPGEEVVKKSAAEKPENKAAIDAMNKSSGGKVGYFAGGTPGGGIVGGLASLALGPVGAAFSILTGGVKAASDAIAMFGGFVAKANPAVMAQVGLAMNDLQGVIGRALVPEVQKLIPVLRFLGDSMDFVMKILMPVITPLVNAFKMLAMPLIELEAVVVQFLAPALDIFAVAVEGFAIMLDPVIQLIAEIVESFTQLIDSFLGGIPITKFMKDGFEILGQVVKMLVGAIVSILGLFMSGMGVILQLTGFLVQGFGTLIKGIGDLISYIPGMGTLGSVLAEAGTSVAAGGDSIKASGADLQKKGEEQRDRGMAKMGEGFENIAGKFGDPDYKMKDETKYKAGDVTGKGIKKGSSMGAAVRETQSTSISGVGDEVRKQALMAGTGAKTQEESLKDIADKLSKDNLRDAFKEGMIAANGADKGNAGIKGKDPFAGAGHSKPSLAPV